MFLCSLYQPVVTPRALPRLAGGLGLQDFRHFVGGGVGGVLLEVAGNGEDGVATAWLGHAVRAVVWGGDLLAGDVVIWASADFDE